MASHQRRRIASGSPYERTIGFSRAVRVGDRVMVAGTAPIWPSGEVDPDPEMQAERCIEIMLAALAEAGAAAADVVRTRSYIVDPADQDAVGRAHGRHFGDIRPASTMVVVAGLVDPRWKVEMEAEAIIGSAEPTAGPSAGPGVQPPVELPVEPSAGRPTGRPPDAIDG